MNFENNLKKYADVVLKKGINLQAGEKILITTSEEGLPLARLIAKQAYQTGAHDVMVEFIDPEMMLSRYLYAPDEAFESYPEYRVDFKEKMLLDGYHMILVEAPDPELLKDVSPERLAKWQKVASKANKRIQKYALENLMKWNIVAVAGKAWAEAVFPELPLEEAIGKLWQNIFDATRISMDDPVAAWEQHDQDLKRHQKFLNDARFEKILYRGEGTDLEVHLPEDHEWLGGSSLYHGNPFFANIPTEEIFSMPHADRVNGTLRATLPLSVRGKIVDKFHFTFKEGLIVDFDAEVEKETLTDLLEMDEGAKRLGEIALVPHNSPISNTRLLFKSTLFDENASCHFALGAAYSENLKGSKDRTEAENRALGMNDSLIHVDFMVGDANLEVIGVKKDGTQLTILKDGDWAI